MEWSKSKDRLQENLKLIRKAGGWSGTEFGKILGVSKQSVANYETGTVILSKMQYIAIRSILDYEIIQNKNEKLKIVVNFCIDSDDIPKNKYKFIQTYLEGAINANLSTYEIINGLATLINRVAVNRLGVNLFEPMNWMKEVICDKE